MSWEQIVDEVQSASLWLPQTRAAHPLAQMASLALSVAGIDAASMGNGPRSYTPDQAGKPGPQETRVSGHAKVVFRDASQVGNLANGL